MRAWAIRQGRPRPSIGIIFEKVQLCNYQQNTDKLGLRNPLSNIELFDVLIRFYAKNLKTKGKK